LKTAPKGQFVTPKSYWVGFTEMNDVEVMRYLKDTGNEDFWQSVLAAREAGLSNAEIMCSMFAKLCYKSLTLGDNANITRIRDIPDNIKGCFDVGHGSIFEHVGFNFVIADCSRVFTHELVRHRIGTAFSQNSGRYIRLDKIDFVFDPILEGCEDLIMSHVAATEFLVYMLECRKGLRKPPEEHPEAPADLWTDMDENDFKYSPAEWPFNDDRERSHYKWVPNNDPKFSQKKKITSAIRRVAPNGQANEIGFSVNLRTLRHTMMLRTSRFAEWEIRLVFEGLYKLLKDQYPLIFYGAKEEEVDGILEISGMKLQPYEKEAEVLLEELSTEQLQQELERRRSA